MAESEIPWGEPGESTEHPMPQDVESLRANFDQVKAEEAQVEQRKTELIQTVRDRIAILERILIEAGAEPVRPVAPPATATLVRSVQRPVIDFVRRELTEIGHPIETSELRQTLMTKYHLPADRLKNLSQVLYKAKSIVKAGGKVGLASWGRPAAAVLRTRKRAVKPTATKEAVHANQ